MPVFADNEFETENSLLYSKKLSKLTSNYDNIYELNILDKKYVCINNNCYDFNSFRYNKLTKTYKIDMIVDLMNWDMQEKYQSPHNDGYISYLLFNVKLHANKFSVKCTGYASGNILVNYSADKAYSASYNIVKIYRNKPANIKNIKDIENLFYKWIDIQLVKKILKAW